jgi:arginine/lysine/ornithine decarboxylase
MREHSQASIEAQQEAPYAEALPVLADKLRIRMQAPGHAGRLLEEIERLFRNFAHFDVSVVPGLDVAIDGRPTPLARAEALAAEAVGAQACSYFTNGASAAASALASALVDVAKGRPILVARNAHISVIHTLYERGAQVTFLPVEVHPILGMATVLDPQDLEDRLARHGYGAVWISTPNYEGVLGSTEQAIQVCKRAGVPVVVDGSWASELPFTTELGPLSPIQLGADAEVGSWHKTLQAPGQDAVAYLGKDSAIPLPVFNLACLRHKTTSKNSVFLAALDLCRRWAFQHADAAVVENREAIREYARLVPDGMLVDWAAELRSGRTIAPASIPYRMTFRTWETGYTGYELARMLLERGLQVAQPNLLYMFMGTGIGRPWVIERTFEKVRELLDELPARPALDPGTLPTLALSAADVDFSEARGDTEPVLLTQAVGRRLAHALGAYPPGLAIKTHGEVLDRGTAEYLAQVRQQRGTLYGGDPGLLKDGYVLVYR